MKRRKPTTRDVQEFTERVEFLEQMWGVKAEYEVDLDTGIAWLKISRPDTVVVLSIKAVHVWDFLLP